MLVLLKDAKLNVVRLGWERRCGSRQGQKLHSARAKIPGTLGKFRAFGPDYKPQGRS
jgi:hypothetical protein